MTHRHAARVHALPRRTSSTRCSSSRSSTTRSSRRPRRSTASPASSTRSRRSSTRPTRATLRGSTGTSASTTCASATATSRTSSTTSTSTCRPGTTVALVGHTGAGKSTIAKLLARFYDPRDGRITIDGHDLRDVTQGSLRRQLGIVPQEGFLFAGTIADNIAFGRPEATRAGDRGPRRRSSEPTRFVSELPDGLDTEVGERGFRLSLGQRQLVAFARALLADPRILILDEATSSVDIGTERRIERGLRRLLDGPDGVHHRAPAVDDPARGPDRRPRPRPDRRGRHARRAHRRAAARTRACTATGRRTSRRPSRRRPHLGSSPRRTSDPHRGRRRPRSSRLALDGAETRLTPAEAIAPMHLRVPARGNRKLRRLLERVNDDGQLKAWWHVVERERRRAARRSTTTRGCTSRSSRTSR